MLPLPPGLSPRILGHAEVEVLRDLLDDAVDRDRTRTLDLGPSEADHGRADRRDSAHGGCR
jgi:hypothetical protein